MTIKRRLLSWYNWFIMIHAILQLLASSLCNMVSAIGARYQGGRITFAQLMDWDMVLSDITGKGRVTTCGKHSVQSNLNIFPFLSQLE